MSLLCVTYHRLLRQGLLSPVKLEGDTPDLGDFEIEIVDGPSNEYHQDGIDQDLSRTQWIGLNVPEGNVWRAKGNHRPIALGCMTDSLTFSSRYRCSTAFGYRTLQSPTWR
jgi:hypothetical protein